MRGNTGRKLGGAQYSEHQIRSILNDIGIRIVAETENDFLVYCPIHGNRHTPSMSVSKTHDGFICFNGDCGVAGDMVRLVQLVTKRNQFEALRFVISREPTDAEEFEFDMEALLADEPEFKEFPQKVLDKLHQDFGMPECWDYMKGRGFTLDTMEYFKTGYSKNRHMITIPVHALDGTPVGLVARDIYSKKFKNSAGLQTSKLFFNLHRAKRIGSTVIVTEACFDTMMVHQAGFPNVVANLGSSMSAYKLALLDKFFDRIIIMADNRDYDKAGLALGVKIAEGLKHKDVLWATFKPGETYPRDVKDAADMTSDEVTQCIKNAIPHYEIVAGMV